MNIGLLFAVVGILLLIFSAAGNLFNESKKSIAKKIDVAQIQYKYDFILKEGKI